MKAIEQYFPVVLFIMLYKVELTFESVDEILKGDHSNESCWEVLSCGSVFYAVQGGANILVCGWNPKVWTFKWTKNYYKQYFPVASVYCAAQRGSNFWICEWILRGNHPYESYRTELSY